MNVSHINSYTKEISVIIRMGGIFLYNRKKVLFIVFIGIIVVSSFLIDLRIKASILELAQSNAQLKSMELINEVVNEKVVSGTDYDDIVKIHKDDEGQIVMIQANTSELNRVIAQTIAEVARGMSQLEEEQIRIPLGQVSGLRFLAGYGPKISVRMIPAGQVKVKVHNRLEQAGINQTLHLICLDISSTIRIAVPFVDRDIDVATSVPLAETIIVGRVPDTYVQFQGMGEALEKNQDKASQKN